MIMMPEHGLPRIMSMLPTDIPGVMIIERACQPSPWSEKLFHDCLRVKYPALVLRDAKTIHAFAIHSTKVGECHLFNLCVHPDAQGKGYGNWILERVIEDAKKDGAEMIYLEVRKSNDRAMRLYKKYGFKQTGERKDYYNDPDGNKEDAWVYSLDLEK